MVKEFKDFFLGGNLIDLAVAFIIGGIFAGVITAFVDFILMPILGVLFGKPSFDEVMILTINNSRIRIGSFLTVLVAAVLVAAAVFFLIVKPYMKARKPVDPAAPSEAELLTEIRDLLARR